MGTSSLVYVRRSISSGDVSGGRSSLTLGFRRQTAFAIISAKRRARSSGGRTSQDLRPHVDGSCPTGLNFAAALVFGSLGRNVIFYAAFCCSNTISPRRYRENLDSTRPLVQDQRSGDPRPRTADRPPTDRLPTAICLVLIDHAPGVIAHGPNRAPGREILFHDAARSAQELFP
jgi:hypothetical protein